MARRPPVPKGRLDNYRRAPGSCYTSALPLWCSRPSPRPGMTRRQPCSVRPALWPVLCAPPKGPGPLEDQPGATLTGILRGRLVRVSGAGVSRVAGHGAGRREHPARPGSESGGSGHLGRMHQSPAPLRSGHGRGHRSCLSPAAASSGPPGARRTAAWEARQNGRCDRSVPVACCAAEPVGAGGGAGADHLCQRGHRVHHRPGGHRADRPGSADCGGAAAGRPGRRKPAADRALELPPPVWQAVSGALLYHRAPIPPCCLPRSRASAATWVRG